jgi:ribose transport system ATP-binding protein
MISSELSELLSACDRTVVVSDGRIMDDINRIDLDRGARAGDGRVMRLQAAEHKLQLRSRRL